MTKIFDFEAARAEMKRKMEAGREAYLTFLALAESVRDMPDVERSLAIEEARQTLPEHIYPEDDDPISLEIDMGVGNNYGGVSLVKRASDGGTFLCCGQSNYNDHDMREVSAEFVAAVEKEFGPWKRMCVSVDRCLA